jgi:hypothetical protein
MKTTYLECPNCQSIWGYEEIDWQTCDCCGWPDVDEDFKSESDYFEDDDFDYYEEAKP